MRLVVRALRAKRVRRVILDIDSTLIDSEVRIAERTYEGFRGFNPPPGDAASWRDEFDRIFCVSSGQCGASVTQPEPGP